jgi:hypothetical protein
VAWYWWILLWLVVLLLTGGVLALLGLSLFRKAKALLVEVSTAADRLSAVSESLQELAEQQKNDPAVFTTASQLRQEQFLNSRQPKPPSRDGKHSPGPRSAVAQRPQTRVRQRDPRRTAYDDIDR